MRFLILYFTLYIAKVKINKGENGYGKIARNKGNFAGIANMASYPILHDYLNQNNSNGSAIDNYYNEASNYGIVERARQYVVVDNVFNLIENNFNVSLEDNVNDFISRKFGRFLP